MSRGDPSLHTLGPFRRLLFAVRARFFGMRDGRLRIPRAGGAPDSDDAREYHRLHEHGSWFQHRLARDYAQGDHRLLGDYEVALAAKEQLEKAIPQFEHEVEAAESEVNNRMNALRSKRSGDERRVADTRLHVPTPIYVATMAIVLGGEFPLNSIAFRVFSESQNRTNLLTLGLASALVLCAHCLGLLLRHHDRSVPESVFIWLLILVPLGVVVGVGVARMQSLEASTVTISVDFFNRLGFFWGTVLFSAINAFVYLTATTLSYLNHEPLYKEIRGLRIQIFWADRTLVQRRRHLEGRQSRVRSVEQQIHHLSTARDGWFLRAKEEAARHRRMFAAFMEAYRAANRRALERAVRLDVRRGVLSAEDFAAEAWLPDLLTKSVRPIEEPEIFKDRAAPSPRIGEGDFEKVVGELVARLARYQPTAPEHEGDEHRRPEPPPATSLV